MRRDVPIHRLRENDTVFTPAHVMFLDTETRTVKRGDDEILGLRLWCAHSDDRRPTKSGKQNSRWDEGETPQSLADAIAERLIGRPYLWIYAHNLAFDLTTTRLPLELIRRGWTVTDFALSGGDPWIRLRKGSHRVTIADSKSWLPMPLAEVGKVIGIGKPDLPDNDAAGEAWRVRCRADVQILATAMLDLMDWWDDKELGRWTITGNASGWNAFRHIKTIERVVIKPDDDEIRHDRSAIYGGRRGVWRVGKLSAGPFLELDITAAYPTVAATCLLPYHRRAKFPRLDVNDWRIQDAGWSVIAEAEIRTDAPCAPLKTDRGTVFPVGHFKTTLAGPELAELRAAGRLVAIGAGYTHQMGTVMQPWARWVLSEQNGECADSPRIARHTCKHWGRVVIGKWGAHGYERTRLGNSPSDEWGYEEGWDGEHDTRGGMVDIGSERYWVAASDNGENAYPGILAFVESHIRLRLGRIIDALGRGAVIQCDTDGLIVAEPRLGTQEAGGTIVAPPGLSGAARTSWVLQQLQPLIAPLTVRIKRASRHVTIIGPQHLQTDTQRRYSGIPGMATPDEDGRLVAHLWPGLKWQMSNGDPAGYVRPLRRATLSATYAPGWVLTTGIVIPPEARINSAGQSELVPWERMTRKPRGATLAGAQNPAFRNLW